MKNRILHRDRLTYDALHGVLEDAYQQVAAGKGVDRHGDATGHFGNQIWAEITARTGPGFLQGQAMKKLDEGMRLTSDARRKELLGVVAYVAMLVMYYDHSEFAPPKGDDAPELPEDDDTPGWSTHSRTP